MKLLMTAIQKRLRKFDDQLISPKQFVHISGKATLKDWKRAIRMGGVMLRKIMDSGQLDFYQHATLCTNTCRSTKFDLLINNTRFPPDSTGLSSTSSQAQESSANGKIDMTEGAAETRDCVSKSAGSLHHHHHHRHDFGEISEDTLNFWKGIADVGLLGEVVTKISTELLDLLNNLQLLKESAVLQNTEVAALSNLGQVFGLLNSVKKMLAKRRQQTHPSQAQILRILCDLESQLAEQRKQQQNQALPWSCPPHPAAKSSIKRQTKRLRLHKPLTSVNRQPAQVTILSPISLSSLAQPLALADLPITSLAQSSNIVTLLPAGSQLFTRYVLTGDGKADGVTLHASSDLTLVDSSPAQESSQLSTVVKPVELLHLSQRALCAEAVAVEAAAQVQVPDGTVLLRHDREHALLHMDPRSVEEGEVAGLPVPAAAESGPGESAGIVQQRMEVTVAQEPHSQMQGTHKQGTQSLELDARGRGPGVQLVVVRENIVPSSGQVNT
ncbi:glucocorticoid modulatory element-binding protein 1-like isoform X2 [Syngnathus acus]|uniref:glucocorticoid modulatory element-binding protein 1-like isoform X2 n=1 Tax=Syngnathus acus TaxID=161584 RepID=UPI001886338B|nr:glucocorticoid modulatory element-binding protein 1-like isoform X2 [Syngnathus acus]